MRGLGGSSSIKASRIEEGKRERVMGVGRTWILEALLLPPSPLIWWGIVADTELWRYRCKKVCMEGEEARRCSL